MYHKILSMPRLLTYRQLLFGSTRDDLAGPLPAPRITRFVVRSDELLHPFFFSERAASRCC